MVKYHHCLGLVAVAGCMFGLPGCGSSESKTVEVPGAGPAAWDLNEDGECDLDSEDANGDGLFTSSDMVQVFQAGEYEDGIPDNSTFAEGDWNGDGEFTSSDMVAAFQTGLYEVKSQTMASEIAAAVDWLFAQHQRLARQHAYVA